MGTQLPSPEKGNNPPIFGPCLVWPNGWMDQGATLYGSKPRPTRCCVRWVPSSPPKRGTAPPQFSTHVCCGQTAGCIRIPLGTEVSLVPGDIVRWVPSSHPKKGHNPQIFGLYLLWPNGWMDQDATLYEGTPRPMPHCVRWGPSPCSPTEKGTTALPLFGPCLLWPWSPISATAELLYHSHCSYGTIVTCLAHILQSCKCL